MVERAKGIVERCLKVNFWVWYNLAIMEKAQKPNISYERRPRTLQAFFALKFHDGDEDRAKVETIGTALNQAGVEIVVMARDVEKWGEAEISGGKTLMKDFAFPVMRQCDCNIIEFSEKGVGLGMNGGYCYAMGKPIFVIAKTGSEISATMADIATKVIFYDNPEDLIEPFKRIVDEFPRVILASSSFVRRQQMIDASIPFEVFVSDVDEAPDETKSLKDQLADIAMRKAMAVFEKTKDRDLRLIVAADQNIMFEGELYGKQDSIESARELILRMRGSDEIYSYTGNAILLAKKDQIVQSINVTDVARTSVDDISDERIEEFLETGTWAKVCGAANINNADFVHLKEGRLSTAKGMTIEYVQEMMANLYLY